MNIINHDRITKILSVVLAVVFGVLFVTLVANAVTTISGTTVTLENAETISNGTDGTITLGADVLKLVGTASTSAIRVGDESDAPVLDGLVDGYCTIAAIDVSAATTTYALCTGATGVISGDKVFVQATSSLPVSTIITAASSTATAGTINLRFHAMAGAATIAANTVSVWFWAVR